jgi:hypothetical protein
MTLNPKYQNPLKSYINGNNPPITVDGLVVDGVYAVTGVIDTVTQTNNTYQDPLSNQISNVGSYSFSQNLNTNQWFSGIVDDQVNTTYQLTFQLNRDTYLNTVTFELLQVPLTWTLNLVTQSGTTQLSTGVITEFNSNNWQYFEVLLGQTYLLQASGSTLQLVLTKTLTGSQYQFGVTNFLIQLNVETLQDVTVNNTVVSGITTQNVLGFVESYNPNIYSINNINDAPGSGTYWKCSPQPVGDSIVYFVLDLGGLLTINSMYIDPLYTGTVFNLYYSYDNSYWYPVQRDFRLKKGMYQLPTIFARYLKFEFTQLTPEPYDLKFDSVQKTISVFPDWVDNFYTLSERAIPDIANQNYAISSAVTPTSSYNTSISTNTFYGSAANTLNNLNGPNSTFSSANSVNSNTTITDPTVSYKTVQSVAGLGSQYNPVTDVAFITRRFPYASQHVYKQVPINQTWHEAYFTGIKTLQFFKINQNVQMDYPDFTDYFTSNALTIVSGSTTATFRNPQIITNTISGTTYSLVSGTGYTGLAGSKVITNNLKTFSNYSSFKFASLSSDWVPYLTNSQTVLLGSNLATLGITVSGIQSSTNTQSTTNYGVWTFTPSGNPIQSYVQSAAVGNAQNLLTIPEALVTSGTGWSGPINSSQVVTNASISGVSTINIPLLGNTPWEGPEYGGANYSSDPYGSTSALGSIQPRSYTFLITGSGTGTATPYVTYSGTSTTTYSGTPVSISGSGNFFTFTTSQPTNTSVVSFSIAVSGSVSFSNAGYFLGATGFTPSSWSTPLVASGMRISAVARVYLPNTNFGTYKCTLYSNGSELAHKQFSNIPLRTWVDIEVPFTLTQGYYNSSNFSAKLTQTNGQGEVYSLSMLGIFYNPVAWEYCSDGTGSNWNWITTGINDPNTNINLRGPSNQIQLRATILQDGSQISAVSLVPNYTQSPYYSTTQINYLGDPKTNELSWKRTPGQRPLFQLRQELHPAQYDIGVLMNIAYPYSLD